MALPAVSINYLAVLVAAIVAFFFGWLWHGPLFGKVWMKLSGMTEKSMKSMKKSSMMKPMAIAFVISLIAIFVLSLFVDYAQATTVFDALEVACLVWLGFVVPMLASGSLWEGKSWKLFGFGAVYHLINLSIISIILTLWV